MSRIILNPQRNAIANPAFAEKLTTNDTLPSGFGRSVTVHFRFFTVRGTSNVSDPDAVCETVQIATENALSPSK